MDVRLAAALAGTRRQAQSAMQLPWYCSCPERLESFPCWRHRALASRFSSFDQYAYLRSVLRSSERIDSDKAPVHAQERDALRLAERWISQDRGFRLADAGSAGGRPARPQR